MKWMLDLSLNPLPRPISHEQKTCFIGSCFSEEIGKRMEDLKFRVMLNPHGIIYDPLSISNTISRIIQNKYYTADDLVLINGLWHSWEHHSKFAGLDKERVLENINIQLHEAYQWLKQCSWLIITPGTSFSFSLKSNSKEVANCHKAPGEMFVKNMLTIGQITQSFVKMLDALIQFNPGINIIWTVSPVRHIKDGIVENNVSKARLLESVHHITGMYDNLFYFPAYELVIDVLRDYRFYKPDLVHPTEQAADYVFEQFGSTVFDQKSNDLNKEIKGIIMAYHHKPFNKESKAHQEFLKHQIQNINRLLSQHPFLDFQKETGHFQAGLVS